MNTSEIKRTLGIFTPEEKALREDIAYFEMRITTWENRILNLARREETGEGLGDRSVLFQDWSDELRRLNRKVTALRNRLQELEPQLDAVS